MSIDRGECPRCDQSVFNVNILTEEPRLSGIKFDIDREREVEREREIDREREIGSPFGRDKDRECGIEKEKEVKNRIGVCRGLRAIDLASSRMLVRMVALLIHGNALVDAVQTEYALDEDKYAPVQKYAIENAVDDENAPIVDSVLMYAMMVYFGGKKEREKEIGIEKEIEREKKEKEREKEKEKEKEKEEGIGSKLESECLLKLYGNSILHRCRGVRKERKRNVRNRNNIRNRNRNIVRVRREEKKEEKKEEEKRKERRKRENRKESSSRRERRRIWNEKK